VLSLIGLAVKNILSLRLLLISGQGLLIYAGYARGNWIVLFWNSIFLAINLFRTILLLLERRPVKLPHGLEDLYNNNFIHMTEREFLRFWSKGKAVTFAENECAIKSGQDPENVFIITEGRAVVRNRTGRVAVLSRGGFVGEMSYISNKVPAADVVAGPGLVLWGWKKADLNRLKISDHTLWVKVQQALGQDLVHKVNRMSSARKETHSGLLSKASEFSDED